LKGSNGERSVRARSAWSYEAQRTQPAPRHRQEHRRGAEELGLEEGASVTAVVKASDVILATDE
jgi:hypothetical protein